MRLRRLLVWYRRARGQGSRCERFRVARLRDPPAEAPTRRRAWRRHSAGRPTAAPAFVPRWCLHLNERQAEGDLHLNEQHAKGDLHLTNEFSMVRFVHRPQAAPCLPARRSIPSGPECSPIAPLSDRSPRPLRSDRPRASLDARKARALTRRAGPGCVRVAEQPAASAPRSTSSHSREREGRSGAAGGRSRCPSVGPRTAAGRCLTRGFRLLGCFVAPPRRPPVTAIAVDLANSCTRSGHSNCWLSICWLVCVARFVCVPVSFKGQPRHVIAASKAVLRPHARFKCVSASFMFCDETAQLATRTCFSAIRSSVTSNSRVKNLEIWGVRPEQIFMSKR